MDSRLRRRHPPPPPAGTGAGPSGRDDFWSEAATAALIEAWGDRYLQLNRGSLRQKDWEDVSATVNDALAEAGKPPRTDAQCKNRMDTLKKKYKVEKMKAKARLGRSQWPFFPHLDALLGDAAVGGGVVTKKPSTSPSTLFGIPQPRPLKSHSSSHDPIKIPIPAAQVAAHTALFSRPRRMSSPESSESSQGRFHPLDGGSDNDESNDVEETESYYGEKHKKNGLFNVAASRKRSRGFSSIGKRGTDNGGDGDNNVAVYGAGSGFTELAGAIMRFVDVYERVESSKQQQMLDIDRRWMEFTKELEFQKMKMFMEAQLEIEKMKRPKIVACSGKP